MPNRNAIFSNVEKIVPSMCMVAPSGSTISLISLGTPIFLAASRFTGNVATELWVAMEVAAGGSMNFHILLKPSFPAAQ